MMKSMDLTVRDALYLYTICSILPDSRDFLPYKESLFLWLCIEPPRYAWRRPAIQQILSISTMPDSLTRSMESLEVDATSLKYSATLCQHPELSSQYKNMTFIAYVVHSSLPSFLSKIYVAWSQPCSGV